MEQIENYIQVPVGQAHDFTGQEFENIKVLYRTDPPKHITYKKPAYWLYQFKDLILETTNFLFTKEKEKEYYAN